MIDPATELLKVAKMKTKSADVVANIAETAWFARYPWPEKVFVTENKNSWQNLLL